MNMRTGVVLITALALAGCATGSRVIVGQTRPPIDPSNVRIYASPPSQPYDQVAILDAQGAGLGSQTQMNSVIHKLKEEAAAVGANGILIQSISGKRETAGFGTYAGSGGAFGTGTFLGEKKAEGSAMAIYVHTDPMMTPGYVPPNAVPQSH